MNAKLLIASVAFYAAAAPLFAGDYVDFSNVVSTRTRAEVVAELRQAQSDGTLAAANSEYVVFSPLASTARSRADVRAEAIESAKNHSTDKKGIYFGG